MRGHGQVVAFRQENTGSIPDISFFCSTSLPLARLLEGFDQCYQASAVHCSKQQRRQLTSATSRIQKNSTLEHTPHNLEIVVSNPAWCWAFSSSFDFFSISSYFPSPVECPKSGPLKGGASITVCCERNIIKMDA